MSNRQISKAYRIPILTSSEILINAKVRNLRIEEELREFREMGSVES